MRKILYAIKVADLSYSGLKILNIKIGQTLDIQSTLRQYRRSNPEVKLLDLWEINPMINNPYECERGIHKLAERYAYDRKGEKFIFLQESYQSFSENVDLLLRNITSGYSRKKRNIAKKRNTSNYTKKKPTLVIFQDKKFKVSTWRDVLCKVAREIYNNQKDFTPALGIKGRKRIYFSKNDQDLISPQRIENSPYFCEGDLSANQIMKIVEKLLNVSGYSSQNLKVICK